MNNICQDCRRWGKTICFLHGMALGFLPGPFASCLGFWRKRGRKRK